MHRYSKLSLLALTITAAASMAYAATGAMGDKENDALATATAKVSLIQAVETAQQHTGGKATHAEYEHSKQGWVVDVEVVNGVKVFDVRVDADKGTVISSAEDKAEHADEHDKKD